MVTEVFVVLWKMERMFCFTQEFLSVFLIEDADYLPSNVVVNEYMYVCFMF